MGNVNKLNDGINTSIDIDIHLALVFVFPFVRMQYNLENKSVRCRKMTAVYRQMLDVQLLTYFFFRRLNIIKITLQYCKIYVFSKLGKLSTIWQHRMGF